MTDAEIMSRAKVLMQAFIDMFNSQDKTIYVIGIQESVAVWDGAECDATCLKEEMEELIEEINEKEQKNE